MSSKWRYAGLDIGWRRIGVIFKRERPINPKYRQGIPAGVTVKPEDIALPQLPDNDEIANQFDRAGDHSTATQFRLAKHLSSDDPRRKDFWRY